MDATAQAIAAAVMLTGGEGALHLLPTELASPARDALLSLSSLDAVRRATTLGRTLPAALRPVPAPDAATLAELARGVPSLGPALRTLGLPVTGAAPTRGPRGPSRAVLGAIAAAIGPAAAPVAEWCPALAILPVAGIRLLARAVGDLDARAAAEICRQVAPAEAEAIIALWRNGQEGDFAVARRILGAASRDRDPAPLALRAGAYRLGWALGARGDAPAGWPAEIVGAVRRAQSAAALLAAPGDATSERAALASESQA